MNFLLERIGVIVTRIKEIGALNNFFHTNDMFCNEKHTAKVLPLLCNYREQKMEKPDLLKRNIFVNKLKIEHKMKR